MKLNQVFLPGYVHANLTFGKGSSAETVPLVEADFSLLLDNGGSIQSRDGSTSPPQCSTFTSRRNYCLVIYCWRDNAGVFITAWLAIQPGASPRDNPISIASNNVQTISLSIGYNTGANNWFADDHECSNKDTLMYTNHYLTNTSQAVAYVQGLQCNDCVFNAVGCVSNTGWDSSNNNLKAWSSNSAVIYSC